MPEATPPKSGPDGGAEGPMKDAEPAGKVAKITKPLSPVQRRISAHKSRVAQALRPWATRATNMLTGTAWFAKLAKKVGATAHDAFPLFLPPPNALLQSPT
eukprot:70990-Chlamydomonas_euryale.AAC.2